MDKINKHFWNGVRRAREGNTIKWDSKNINVQAIICAKRLSWKHNREIISQMDSTVVVVGSFFHFAFSIAVYSMEKVWIQSIANYPIVMAKCKKEEWKREREKTHTHTIQSNMLYPSMITINGHIYILDSGYRYCCWWIFPRLWTVFPHICVAMHWSCVSVCTYSVIDTGCALILCR